MKKRRGARSGRGHAAVLCTGHSASAPYRRTDPGFITPPFNFAADPGDVITIVGWDFGGVLYIGPLYLHCTATGAVQVLDPTGVPSQPSPPEANPGNHIVFYNRNFTVNL